MGGFFMWLQVTVWRTTSSDTVLSFVASAATMQINPSSSQAAVGVGLLLDGCRVTGANFSRGTDGIFAASFDPPARFNGYYLVTGAGGATEVSWAAQARNNAAWVTADPFPARLPAQYPGLKVHYDLRSLWPFWAVQSLRYLTISVAFIVCSAAGAVGQGAAGRMFLSFSFLLLAAIDAVVALGVGPAGPAAAAPGRQGMETLNWAKLPEHLVVVIGMEVFESRVFAVFSASCAVQVCCSKYGLDRMLRLCLLTSFFLSQFIISHFSCRVCLNWRASVPFFSACSLAAQCTGNTVRMLSA